MASAGTSHDVSLVYDCATGLDPEWGRMVYQLLADGTMQLAVMTEKGTESVTLTGPCPRCAGDVRFSLVLTSVTAESASATGPSGQSLRSAAEPGTTVREIVAYCACDGAHAGRPATLLGGCGAAFVIAMEVA